ncbi:MAG: prepilin-type N-terminal cleavage/methylation domain-containing protein [bacterium]
MQRKGFSLIEVVISMVVIAIVMYAVIAVFITSGAKGVNVEIFTVAQSLAEGKMEEMMARPYGDLNTIGPINYTGDLLAYTYTITVNDVEPLDFDTIASAPPSNYRRIIIAINHPIMTDPVTLESVRANY